METVRNLVMQQKFDVTKIKLLKPITTSAGFAFKCDIYQIPAVKVPSILVGNFHHIIQETNHLISSLDKFG